MSRASRSPLATVQAEPRPRHGAFTARFGRHASALRAGRRHPSSPRGILRCRRWVSETSRALQELKALMGRVLDSDASEAFGRFMVRQVALSDMAPNADDAVLEGIESPASEAAVAQAHLEACLTTSVTSSSTGPRRRPAAGCARPSPSSAPSARRVARRSPPWWSPSRRSRARGLDGRRAPLVEPRAARGPSAASTTPAMLRSTTTCGL